MSSPLAIEPPDRSTADLDELAGLWQQMQAHQIEVSTAPGLNRDLEQGWVARRAFYERELAAGGAIIRARRDGQLVGYCAVSVQRGLDDTFEADGIATIITLSVTAQERGQGIGSMLLEAAGDFARTVPASVLALEVMPGNDRAASLYRLRGFEPVEVRMHRQL